MINRFLLLDMVELEPGYQKNYMLTYDNLVSLPDYTDLGVPVIHEDQIPKPCLTEKWVNFDKCFFEKLANYKVQKYNVRESKQ